MDTKNEAAIARMKDAWSAELKRQKEAWAASERIKRDQWMDSKAQEIKQITVKGLEQEVGSSDQSRKVIESRSVVATR